jgi:hypothetical protein
MGNKIMKEKACKTGQFEKVNFKGGI